MKDAAEGAKNAKVNASLRRGLKRIRALAGSVTVSYSEKPKHHLGAGKRKGGNA